MENNSANHWQNCSAVPGALWVSSVSVRARCVCVLWVHLKRVLNRIGYFWPQRQSCPKRQWRRHNWWSTQAQARGNRPKPWNEASQAGSCGHGWRFAFWLLRKLCLWLSSSAYHLLISRRLTKCLLFFCRRVGDAVWSQGSFSKHTRKKGQAESQGEAARGGKVKWLPVNVHKYVHICEVYKRDY